MHANLMRAAHEMAGSCRSIDEAMLATKLAMAGQALRSAVRLMETIQENNPDIKVDSDVRFYEHVLTQIGQ